MDPYLGQVLYVAFPYAPSGWAVCDGQVLPIASNQALYALLGNRFGGDGRTTFGLPKLTAAATTPTGLLPVIAVSGIFPPRP
ncbi:phage tail protein [Oleisolibacter albus]|uniref:phage tail protein n=1 Tax=Oleisolibacter albus TaxID=2171757 RepID=UPI000DF340BF|nr:tail fiber protein [Oleisolibacter albus]